jgi:hypothetical protein
VKWQQTTLQARPTCKEERGKKRNDGEGSTEWRLRRRRMKQNAGKNEVVGLAKKQLSWSRRHDDEPRVGIDGSYGTLMIGGSRQMEDAKTAWER